MFGCKTAAGSPQLHQPGSRAQEETEGSWQVAYVIMILDDTTPAAAEALVLSQALQLPSKHLPVTHCRKPEDRGSTVAYSSVGHSISGPQEENTNQSCRKLCLRNNKPTAQQIIAQSSLLLKDGRKQNVSQTSADIELK